MKRKKTHAGSSAGFAQLQNGLTGKRTLVGSAYMDDPVQLRAYLDYYWPVSRAQAGFVIAAVKKKLGMLFPNIPPESFFQTILDVCSGPGPVAAACIDAGAKSVTLFDKSKKALDLASKELSRQCHYSEGLSISPGDISSPVPGKIPFWGKADGITFGHCLNELWEGKKDRIERRAELLETYASALSGTSSVPGLVIVIEPALLSTSRDLLAVRDLLISRGWSVLLPCPGREILPCPALAAGEQHTCHEDFHWNVPSKVARLAEMQGIHKDLLKMTWFAFIPPSQCFSWTNPFTEEKDIPCGAEIYRVVSEPMLNKAGRIRRLLCGANGRFPISVDAASPDVQRTHLAELRRGELVYIESPEIRINGWGINSNTTIKKE